MMREKDRSMPAILQKEWPCQKLVMGNRKERFRELNGAQIYGEGQAANFAI
jgi:hypothetical protein